MKLSQLIIGLLLSVSCFFVQAQNPYCAVEETKLKPVFINGMSNSRGSARDTAKLMTKRMQNIYGSN